MSCRWSVLTLMLICCGLTAEKLGAQDPFGDAPADAGGEKPAAAPEVPGVPPKKKKAAEAEKPAAEKEAALGSEAERNPVVLAIRDMKPTKPEDLMFAVNSLVDIGRTDEAKTYLKKLVAEPPSRELLASFYQKYSSAFFFQLSRDHRLRPEGEQLGRLVLDAASAVARDPAHLKSLVKQLNAPSASARDSALEQLRGADMAALPAMLEALADANRVQEQPRVRAALVAMGQPALDPLLAALECADPKLRAQVLTVVGRFHSNRAIPLLIGPCLLPDSPAEVRRAAEQALREIVGQPASQKQLEQFLYLRAKAFFEGDVPGPVDHEDMIEMWRWDDQQKTSVARRYPQADASLMMAARLARELYRVAPENPDYRRLYLVSNLQFAQQENGLDRELPRGPGTIYATVAAFEVPTIEDLLDHALDKDYVAVGIAAAQLLGNRGGAELVQSESGRPRPLVRALNHGDRRLRLAAARAIMRIDPKSSYAGSSHLPEALAFIVRSAGTRRVLITHPRLERAQSLAGLLGQAGYEAESCRSGKDTFRRACANPDVAFVLISDAIDFPNANEAIQLLRRDPRTSRLPVGLMAREEHLREAERIAAGDPLVLAFPRPHDAQSMAFQTAHLADLNGRHATTGDERLQQAEEALDYLARIAQKPAEYGYYDLLRHQAALQEALFISRLAAKAAVVLGALGSPQAQQALLTCASQHARPLADRQAAAKGFATAVRQRGILLTKDEIRVQYERYNQSELLDSGTQQVLASILDVLEGARKKPTPASAGAADGTVPQPPAAAPANDDAAKNQPAGKEPPAQKPDGQDGM